MYLIINDIYSIYFPYFRLFLNCLLVDMTIVYLAPPTEKQYAAGGQYHKRTDYYSYMYYPRRGEGEICYRRVSVYMTPQLITD